LPFMQKSNDGFHEVLGGGRFGGERIEFGDQFRALTNGGSHL